MSKQENTTIKGKLKDIINDISWARFSKRYFNQSSAWIYDKLHERDGNGDTAGFSQEEKEKFKQSLLDYAKRVENCANEI